MHFCQGNDSNSVSYQAPPAEVVSVQQPPTSYSAPAPREQPPPATYDGPTVTERPPRTTTKRTTTSVVTEKPPTTYSATSPVTFAPTFINDELPPYQPEDNLPSYGDDLPDYKQSASIFVTPTPPPIVIPPKTMPGRRLKPSFRPRSNQKFEKIAFSSTLLPPIQPLRITTTTVAPSSQKISSFSDIFSQGEKKSEEQRTSYRNNAPAPSYVAYNDDYEEEDSYGRPQGQPISNSHSEPPLQAELTPPSDKNFPEYIDYNDVTISGVDPRLSSEQTVPQNSNFNIRQKLKKKETSDKRFETHDNSNFNGHNNFDETTRIKGILKQDTTPFSRLDNSPPPSVQFSDGYSAPLPETKTPNVFSEILEPPETTASSYIAPVDIDDYKSPPRGPDSSYSVSVEPTITNNEPGLNNGHSGSLKIDLNIHIKKDETDRPSSNSHGPVQTTYQPARPQSGNLPHTESYATPARHVGPTGSGTTDRRPPPAVFTDILQQPAGDDYAPPQADQEDDTEAYQPPSDRPSKARPGSGHPRSFGSKLTDDRPNDIVAPDYNIDVYQDDFTAPDVDAGYDVPSAPVVGDYYNAPVVDDYIGPASYEYEDNYFGHEAPGYEEFVEYDYHTEKPRKKHKHKKVKPFVDFGSHSTHSKPKHHFKHQKFKQRPHEPVYDDHHFSDDFYDSEPHLEKPNYQEEIFYEPIEKPHQEDFFYEPLEKPIIDPYYDEPFDDYQENLYIDPVPKGYYDKTTDLIPELKDIVRPLDWNVHDFSSWRRILDKTRFGGTIKSSREYDNQLSYRPPEISNEIDYSYSPESYKEPLYYEDYYHDYQDDESTPYTPNLYDYDTYEQSHYNPPPPLVVPEPFNIPFDDWLDSSGVGAFGLPSVKYSTYASPPAYPSFSHIGPRDESYDSYWVPSERPPAYRANNLRVESKSQVEVPVVRDLYTPAPRVLYRRVTPRQDTQSSSPGSIWTGLASFADSLGPRNHYRGHSVGMVSMGSDSDGMLVMGSQDFAVMVKPPTDFNITTGGADTSQPTEALSDKIKTPAGDHSTDPDFSIPGSVSQPHGETTNNTLSSQSSSTPTDFEHYILHSSVIAKTLSKMSNMLKTYLK